MLKSTILGETVQELKKSIMEGSYNTPDYVSPNAAALIARMLETDVSKRIRMDELKRLQFFGGANFTTSYKQFSITPDERELDKNEIEKSVWSTLGSYGVSAELLREAAQKGARNAIVGM